ncbi:MAG: isoprenylcysteine carboxylmethyltransferase family protein [Marinosulfonomonas sp.]|nr:isoprenylcysteine carboxylmethyltransferase family protein [Marinosulfonomonas sp.]
MNSLDLPPVWLAFFMAIAFVVSRFVPGLAFDLPMQGVVTLVIFVAGLVLMAAAVYELTRAKTTFIPKRDPNALVTSGVFRLTRNPIYLGDALVLTSTVLWLNSGVGLILVPAFVWVIQQRFINAEEATLKKKYASQFDGWAKKTRRWV